MSKARTILKKNPINPKDILPIKGGKPREKEQFCIIDFSNVKPGVYMISSAGRLFSLEEEKELNVYKGKYPKRKLETADGSISTYMINRLVAKAFVPKTRTDINLKRDMIHCKDWNGRNSVYHNLQWVNNTELKIMTAIRDGRSSLDHYRVYVKQLVDLGYSQAEILRLLPDIPASNRKTFVKEIAATV